jgi:hypothetical protein
MEPPPPVVDVERQIRMNSFLESAPPAFSVFNIVALIVIAIAAFVLYKRYVDKRSTEQAHMLRPSPIIAQPELKET